MVLGFLSFLFLAFSYKNCWRSRFVSSVSEQAKTSVSRTFAFFAGEMSSSQRIADRDVATKLTERELGGKKKETTDKEESEVRTCLLL